MTARYPLKLRTTTFEFAVTTLAALLCLTAIPNMVLAEESKTEPKAEAPRNETRDPIAIYKEAGIDREQEATIREYATEYERDSQGKAGEIMLLLKEIRQLSLNPDLDAKKIVSVQKEVNKIQSAMALDKINLLIKIRSVLNAEQKRKLVALIQKSRSKEAQ